jgi:sec-independent protein translocase protein TatA
MFTGLESPTHLLIVLVIVLLLFGGKRIPELAKGLGAGVREFRKGAEGSNEEGEEEKRRRLEARGEDGRSEDADVRDERDS